MTRRFTALSSTMRISSGSQSTELVVGDPGRLRQVLMNLLANALKFTERGEVVVQVDCEESSAATACYRFRVRDTGIGIPPDLRDHIFEAFQQADGSVSRKYGGTGLGLSISSQLVATMGGVLQVDSEIGQGSMFEFSAPFPIANKFKATGPGTSAAGDSKEYRCANAGAAAIEAESAAIATNLASSTIC